jgi:hypothetical protein
MDLDDLKAIFESGNSMDEAYLLARMKELRLSFPPVLKSFLPDGLKKAL